MGRRTGVGGREVCPLPGPKLRSDQNVLFTFWISGISAAISGPRA